jgi:glycosyltransferase involved in cell wall biosynthesis
MKRIFFLGPKPPPVSGYANIVNILATRLLAFGNKVEYVSTVPTYLNALYPGRLWVLARMFYLLGLIVFVAFKIIPKSLIYLNLNGGMGQFFDLGVVVFARLLRRELIIHHNSYSYINSRSKLSGWIFQLAGDASVHIVNCDCMAKALVDRYALNSSVVVISNAAILSKSRESSTSKFVSRFAGFSQRKSLVVGFMGYYNKEKGVDLFAEVIKAAKVNGLAISGVAVGPVREELFYEELMENFSEFVEFCGPRYGKEKDAFFDSIDLLMFPSRYKSEAEPLIIHDALAKGVPVVATKLGCVGELLSQFEGCHTFKEVEFHKHAIGVIVAKSNQSDAEKMRERKILVSAYSKLANKQTEKFENFIASL